jgi:hypothetical protein
MKIILPMFLLLSMKKLIIKKVTSLSEKKTIKKNQAKGVV